MHHNLLCMHRTRFLLWNAICIADITTLHCMPELKPYPEPQNHAQHSLLRSLCHDDLYCFCVFCHLNISISQLHFDLGVSRSTSEKLHNCVQTALTISLPRAQAMQHYCQRQRSWMVHVQCRLHEQHSHSWSGTGSWQPAWGAGGPDQVLSWLNVYTSMHVLKHIL